MTKGPVRHTPLLIGLAGPSCSGKSAIAQCLAESLPGGAALLAMDSYYRDLGSMQPRERHSFNFDLPRSIDLPLLEENLAGLRSGRSVTRPVYLFPEHVRAPMGQVVAPGSRVIVEGLFALYWEQIRRLLSVLVFVDAPDPICLDRRLRRDAEQRGRSRQSILSQYAETVRPMYRRFVEPTRVFAQVIVQGTQPISRSAETVSGALASLV